MFAIEHAFAVSDWDPFGVAKARGINLTKTDVHGRQWRATDNRNPGDHLIRENRLARFCFLESARLAPLQTALSGHLVSVGRTCARATKVLARPTNWPSMLGKEKARNECEFSTCPAFIIKPLEA